MCRGLAGAAALAVGLVVATSAGDLEPPGAVDVLPIVPVRIVNGTDASLSLGISSPCADRLRLRPGQMAVVDGCLRWGLVYHVRAVFWTDAAVLERQDVLFVARPGHDWVFQSRSPRVAGGGGGPPGSSP